MDYSDIRLVHTGSAAASIGLFVLRGGFMLRAPEQLKARWVRIVPHVVDTMLLASALWLAWHLGTEGTRGWLWAKLVALVAYVVTGSIALKRGRTRRARAVAFAAALAIFAYIVSVAVTKSPLGFLR